MCVVLSEALNPRTAGNKRNGWLAGATKKVQAVFDQINKCR